MRATTRGAIAATLVCVVTVAGAPAGARETTWSPAETHGPASGATHVDVLAPRIVTDAAGTDTLAWLESVPESGGQQLVVSRRPAGGAWSDPDPIGSTRDNWDPALAAGPDGEALAVWVHVRRDVSGSMVGTSVLASSFDGAAWSEPETLWQGKAWAFHPSPAVDASGRAVLAWSRGGAHPAQLAAVRTPEGVWSDPTRLDATGSVFVATVGAGIDDRGKATVAWSDEGRLWARRWNGTAWVTARRLAASQPAEATLAVASDGTAAAAFITGKPARVAVRTMTRSGTWGAATVADDRAGPADSALALAPRADGWGVAWTRSDRIRVREVVAGVWRRPRSAWASPDGTPWGVQLAYDGAGEPVVLWLSPVPGPGPATKVLAIGRTGTGWPADPTSVSGDRSRLTGLRLASASDGRLTAAWTKALGARDRAVTATGAAPAPPP
ncbi:MAG: hypothetical protein U0R80_13420 [Nocardioidaceae bacterium]